ncbi:hypothetical protein [Bacillus paranthracis]|uniref:hypothetical protein n=1 Tax=Bacillus paranthracis TaxID=2026186 RepID=UPI0021FD4C47|nr:hypothetical protein [Bacillus paranthracis]UXR28923.1 membrane protein [Bacillus phage Nachito]
MKKHKEVLDFKSFCRGEKVVLNTKEIKKAERKKNAYKLAFKVGVVSTVAIFHAPVPPLAVYAATTAVTTVAASSEAGWEHLINKLLELLDPIAKIFGMIAGIAIMTGNGKIGMERLFWLSLGYITTRKVDAWIGFLNQL